MYWNDINNLKNDVQNLNFAITNFVLKSVSLKVFKTFLCYFAITNFVLKFINGSANIYTYAYFAITNFVLKL